MLVGKTESTSVAARDVAPPGHTMGSTPEVTVAAQPEPAHDAVSGLPEDALPERDVRILAFERQWWRHVGAKEEAIRSQFGLSAARYYQLLNAVIDAPAAERYDPMLVRRLQRARDARTKARAERAFKTSDAPPHTETNR